jgi:hypothetical protein
MEFEDKLLKFIHYKFILLFKSCFYYGNKYINLPYVIVVLH